MIFFSIKTYSTAPNIAIWIVWVLNICTEKYQSFPYNNFYIREGFVRRFSLSSLPFGLDFGKNRIYFVESNTFHIICSIKSMNKT